MSTPEHQHPERGRAVAQAVELYHALEALVKWSTTQDILPAGLPAVIMGAIKVLDEVDGNYRQPPKTWVQDGATHRLLGGKVYRLERQISDDCCALCDFHPTYKICTNPWKDGLCIDARAHWVEVQDAR